MSDINVQTFSGKVNVANDLKVGSSHLMVDTQNNQVGLNISNPEANLHVNGNVYINKDLGVGSQILLNERVATFGGTKTFVVTVASVGGADRFHIDGVDRPALTFHEYQTYIFDQSHASNNGHPIAFAEAVGGVTPYTTGVTSVGTPGQTGAKTTFKVSAGAPSPLYYYCTNHPSTMGSTSSNASVVSSGGAVYADQFVGDGSLLTNLPSGMGGVWNTNAEGEIYFTTSNVGISNADPGHELSVGSNLYVDDDGSNVLVVTGNVKANYFVGDGSRLTNLPSGSGGVWNTNAEGEIYFTTSNVGISNADPGHELSVGSNLYVDDDGSNVLVVNGNVSIGSTLTLDNFTITASYGLNDVLETSNTSSNVMQLTNATTGLVATGNVHALKFIGDGSELTGITLQEVTDNGNVTSNTVQFTNATTGLVTTGNVEVGKELTVTGNTTVSSNLTVSGNALITGNVSDLNIVSNVNMLQTANTASIKLHSNVVTEFPRSKKLIKYPRVTLTADAQTNSGYQGYFVSQASATLSSDSDRRAWNFFDDIRRGGTPGPHFDGTSGVGGARYDTNGNYTAGDSLGDVSGDWMYIRLPDKIQLQSVDLWARYNSIRNPIDATVLGSLNGTNWSVIGSWKNASFGPPSGTSLATGNSTSFTINSNQYYDYIGFVFEKIEANSSGGFINFHEIELFGVPEYDPEAHGTDVVVKSVANVPNTDWLEVYYDAKNYTSGVVQDETSNDIDATIGAATTFDSVNKAWSFSGASNRDGTEFVSGYLPSDFEGNQIHSVSMWLKFDYWHDGAFCIIGKETRTNNDNHKAIHFQFQNTSSASPRILYDFWDNQKSFYLPDDVQPGKWLHMTATYTGNAAIRKMFVNGQELTTFTTNSNYATALALDTTNDLVVRLGSRYPVNSLYSFHGDIANFRLFNQALTSDEAWQLYAYQKEYFGHGDLSMTLKAGRLGIGTSEPRAALDVRGGVNFHSLLASATGGIETQIEDQGIAYKVHSFTSTGTSQITVDKAGFFECLVVAGGGAGGRSNAAGGGGGGVVIQRVFVHAGTYDVVVGAGNTSGVREPFGGSSRTYIEYPSGNRGGNSSVFGLLAIGGGNGGGDDHCGVDGGSGGGCADDPHVIPGRSVQNQEGTNGYGNRGGFTRFNASAGSGGGGAGEPGYDCDPDRYLSDSATGNTTFTALGRDGGNGVGSTIRTGSIQYYGGGGGGAQRTTAPTDQPGPGVGGKGGGGNGGSANNSGSSGSANTGGGGGGTSHNNSNGGNGGSGIVVVRYQI